MKAFWAMVRFNFKSMLITAFSLGRSKKKAATGIASFVFMSVLMLFISVTYSFSLGMAFQPDGLELMLATVLAMGLLFSFIFTIYSAQGSVFGVKDIDLVLSWPVSAFTVMLSRVLALYIETVLIFFMVAVPAGIVYCIFSGASVLIFLPLLLLCAVLPLLCCTVSVLLGGLISFAASRFRHKNLFIVLFSFLLMGGIFFGSLRLNSGLSSNSASDIAALQAMAAAKFPPLFWMVDAIVRFDVVAFLKLAAVSVLPFLLVIWVFSKFYKNILTHLSSQHMKANYKLKNVSASGSFAALLKKEAKRFFGTPIFILNCGFGILFAIGGSIYLLVLKLQGNSEFSAISMVFGEQIPAMLLFSISFLIATIYSAAVSISLEGKNLWILKSAPLSTGKIFGAKAGFNFLLCAIVAVITVPILGIVVSVSAGMLAAILLATLLMGAAISMFGLYINLLLPKMDAENDTAIIKRSASGMIGMFASMGLAGLLLLLQMLMQQYGLGFWLYALASNVILAIFALVAFLLLKYQGAKLFNKLFEE